MSRIAFVFPGQGAQYPGMCKEIAENFSEAMLVFEKAGSKLGIDMKKLCFEGSEEDLKKTENTQPSILTASIAILEVLKAKGIKSEANAGLSLGEYSALVASGAIQFEDAVALVRKRGKYMQEAVPEGEGTMAAIMGLERDVVMEGLKAAREYGIVEAANFNCPGQIVIAGQTKAVENACMILKEKGAKRAMVLPVSAPFHSSLLKPAGDKLSAELDAINVTDIVVPVIANISAQEVRSSKDIRKGLIEQVSSSVLWEGSVRKMIDMGIDTFIEIGPGKTLSAFIKKIDKSVAVFNVEDIESLEKTISGISEVK